ncbi:MAG TPA: amidohydrolase family protein [Verrucomicrobiae bacterium]|nr:amidohydrolase family protein [Verrucomicrobiae bacterium]
MRRAIVFCAATAIAHAAVVHSESLLFTGATGHTVSGDTLSPGKVLVKEGKIVAVGPNIADGGARIVDLTGQNLYPGLIALDTVLGLTEIGAVRATQDNTEPGEYTPDVESWIAVNPDSELIPVARANGIAFFEPVPEGVLVSGQSGLVGVTGWTTEERTFKAPIAMHVFWPSADLDLTPAERPHGEKRKSIEEQARERRAKVRGLMEFFQQAAAYAKATEAAAAGKAEAPEKIPAWEAMLPYVEGKLPIMVHADDVRQIRAAVEWASTNHYSIILADARDAWREAALLAERKIPVVYSHIYTLPPRDSDSYDVQFHAPAVLEKAGVRVVFGNGRSTMDAALTKNLPYLAAQAVAFGFPSNEALKGITLYPAELAGVSDRLGSIERGKDATLFSCDGDILDIRSHVTHLWVRGEEVSLENRHTRLYQKYRNRPVPPVPGR